MLKHTEEREDSKATQQHKTSLNSEKPIKGTQT
jgi:hypothetical protein